ncbi:MAG: efflux RND transporter periplasmic adaptor subunit [Rhodothermaceae bacterium]
MSKTKLALQKLDSILGHPKMPKFLRNRYVFGAVLLIPSFLLFSFVNNFGSMDSTIPTFTVNKSDFQISITESGEIKAKKSAVISAPRVRGQLKITYMIPEGTYVKTGDVVLKFDPSEALTKLKEAKSQLDLGKSEKLKLIANQKSNAAQQESTLKSAELSYELSKLNLTQMRFEAKAEQQKAKLQHTKDSLSYIQTLEDYESKIIIRKSELDKMNIEISQKEDNLAEAQKDVDKLSISASNEGLIVYEHNWSTNSKFSVGDSPWSGQGIIKLPDLSKMESKTAVNEVDVSKIKQGQKVIVTLDAFRDTSFTGIVGNVARLGKRKNRNSSIKVFDILVDIKGQSELLKPGMSTSNKIIINEVPNTIYVPQEAVFEKEGKHFVFVKNGSSFEERFVELGEKSEDYVIITKGLDDEEIVALRNPDELNEEADASGNSGVSLPTNGK